MNRPLIDMTVEDWDGIMAVNARGTFLHAREAVRSMIEGDGGVIVNVASIVAQVAMKDTAVYAASKGAIAQLTKVIAVEYGNRGIRANALAPGVIETDILDGIVPDSRATLASYGSAHPLGRVGQPQDIAEIIAFLASSASAFTDRGRWSWRMAAYRSLKGHLMQSILIVGAERGLGLSLAQTLNARGWSVTGTAREGRADTKALGSVAKVAHIDVTKGGSD